MDGGGPARDRQPFRHHGARFTAARARTCVSGATRTPPAIGRTEIAATQLSSDAVRGEPGGVQGGMGPKANPRFGSL